MATYGDTTQKTALAWNSKHNYGKSDPNYLHNHGLAKKGDVNGQGNKQLVIIGKSYRNKFPAFRRSSAHDAKTPVEPFQGRDPRHSKETKVKSRRGKLFLGCTQGRPNDDEDSLPYKKTPVEKFQVDSTSSTDEAESTGDLEIKIRQTHRERNQMVINAHIEWHAISDRLPEVIRTGYLEPYAKVKVFVGKKVQKSEDINLSGVGDATYKGEVKISIPSTYKGPIMKTILSFSMWYKEKKTKSKPLGRVDVDIESALETKEDLSVYRLQEFQKKDKKTLIDKFCQAPITKEPEHTQVPKKTTRADERKTSNLNEAIHGSPANLQPSNVNAPSQDHVENNHGTYHQTSGLGKHDAKNRPASIKEKLDSSVYCSGETLPFEEKSPGKHYNDRTSNIAPHITSSELQTKPPTVEPEHKRFKTSRSDEEPNMDKTTDRGEKTMISNSDMRYQNSADEENAQLPFHDSNELNCKQVMTKKTDVKQTQSSANKPLPKLRHSDSGSTDGIFEDGQCSLPVLPGTCDTHEAESGIPVLTFSGKPSRECLTKTKMQEVHTVSEVVNPNQTIVHVPEADKPSTEASFLKPNTQIKDILNDQSTQERPIPSKPSQPKTRTIYTASDITDPNQQIRQETHTNSVLVAYSHVATSTTKQPCTGQLITQKDDISTTSGISCTPRTSADRNYNQSAVPTNNGILSEQQTAQEDDNVSNAETFYHNQSVAQEAKRLSTAPTQDVPMTSPPDRSLNQTENPTSEESTPNQSLGLESTNVQDFLNSCPVVQGNTESTVARPNLSQSCCNDDKSIETSSNQNYTQSTVHQSDDSISGQLSMEENTPGDHSAPEIPNNHMQTERSGIVKSNEKNDFAEKSSKQSQKSEKHHKQISETNPPNKNKRKGDSQSARKKKKKRDRTYDTGIGNMGNTCYANSVLQVLGQTPRMYSLLHERKKDANPCTDVLGAIIKDLNESSRTVNSANVRSLFKLVFDRDDSFRLGEQNDSHAFFLSLLNCIEQCEGGRNVCSLFDGYMENIFTYDTCTHVEFSGEQLIRSVLLPIANAENLWDCIKELCREEKYPDNMIPCRECECEGKSGRELTTSCKQLVFSKLPKILVFQLGRFEEYSSYRQKAMRKRCTPITFPEEIEMKEGTEQRKKEYILYGVVNHSGSMGGGHYTASIRVGGYESGTWYSCSDSWVQPSYSPANNPDGGAYLLFYHMLHPESEDIGQQVEQPTLQSGYSPYDICPMT